LASKYVVPAIKRELVLELLKMGFMEVEIAKTLGLSPSLVTRYLKGERGNSINISSYKDISNMVKELASRIARNSLNAYEVAREIDRIAMIFMAKKYLCGLHSRIEPGIDITKCNICPELYRYQLSNDF